MSSLDSLSLRRYGPSPGSHAHDHFQVLWGWHGALELEVDGRGARIVAGRAAVIPPGARHDFRAAGGPGDPAVRCFVLDTCDPSLEPLAGRFVDTAPALPRLLEFLDAQPAHSPLLAAATPLLLGALRADIPAVPERGRRIDWPALEAFVDAHLHQPLPVAALAQRAHLSVSQFAARCVERFGLTPQAWVRERRLAAARRLRATGTPVALTAQRCGYRSPSALTAALRRAGR